MMTKRNDVIRTKARRILAKAKSSCHICGQAIDYTLPHTNPESFVADHVIPIAKGGEDALSNIRAAHRDCNSTKRARLIAPIVRRSGALN